MFFRTLPWYYNHANVLVLSFRGADNIRIRPQGRSGRDMRSSLCLLVVILAMCMLAAAQLAPVLPDSPHVVAVNAVINPASAAPVASSSAELHASLPTTQLSPAMLVASPPPAVRTKVVDRKFVALGALVLALTVADVELTQQCLHAGTCHELNPTLPNSHVGMHAVNMATNLGVMYFAYRRRKSEKWGWWLAPAVDIGAHVIGIGSNMLVGR